MTDPGLPPKPRRSLNLLESLVQEEEQRDKTKEGSDVKIPTSGIESSHSSDSQDNNLAITNENSAGVFKEFKMKDVQNSQGVKSTPNSGFKGKKFTKRRSRSSSSERGKKKGKLVRPFSADVKEETRNKILAQSQSNRPKTSKGPRMRKEPINNDKHEQRRSLSSSSADSYSDDFQDDKYEKLDDTDKARDDFFDSDSDADKDKKDHYECGAKHEERRDAKEKKDGKYSSDTESSDSESSNERKQKQMNGHVSRETERQGRYKVNKSDYHNKENKPGTSKQENSQTGDHQQGQKQVVSNKKDNKQRTRLNSEGSEDHLMVAVETGSSELSSSEDESKTRQKVVKPDSKLNPRRKTLLRRKKVPKTNTLVIDPDKYLQAKVHQKYLELQDLMSCSFIDPRRDVTRQQLYQMELLRDQYHTVSHGLPSSHVIIPRSLPGDIRNKGSRPQSATLPPSGLRLSPGKRAQYLDLDDESYDRAYGTLRSVIDAEQARVTHAIRSDIVAVRYPPTSSKIKPKKKRVIEPKLKTKDESHSEEEDVSEKPSVRSSKSNTSGETTPRKIDHTSGIDHHIKYSKNEELKRWLKQKDKLYRQHVKKEKMKKREEREKLINEANEKIERTLESQKQVKRWMHEKNKELRKRHLEDLKKAKAEAEKAERRKMELSLPGDSMKIRPQSAPAHRPDDIKINEAECKGEKTPGYIKDQIHLKREIQEENKQAKLVKQEPHPPQTKFIYKRPVAGKIKFKMQPDRAKSPHGEKSDSEKDDRLQKGIRMSYDDWLKKKRRDDSAKRRETEKQREMAKSDPELDRIIPDLAKKRIENKLNSRKRVNTGIREFDEQANKSFGGADFTGESERPKSAYRLAGQTSEGPALQIKQVRPQTAPATRGRVPHPKKSAVSPRQAVIPQKADAIMSNSDTSNPFKLPFPPEMGVPKYVAERQRKIFADQMNQRLAEAEKQENKEKEQLEDMDSKISQENGADKSESAHQALITDIMYSPKHKDSSDSSTEEEKVKAKEVEKAKEEEKEKEDVKVDKKDNEHTEYFETETIKTKAKHIEETEKILKYASEIVHRGTENESAHKEGMAENEEVSNNVALQDNVLENRKMSEGQTDETNENKSEEQLSLLRIKAYENLNDIGFGPVIITNDKNSDDSESDSDNASMSNSGTNSENEKGGGADRSSTTEESKMDPLTPDERLQNESEQSHLVGILKESKGSNDDLMPEKVDDQTFIESETLKDDVDKDDMLGSRGKRVSFNEQPTVYQSFESSSTDTITPEQPGELNAEEFGLDAQASLNEDDPVWKEGKEDLIEGTLSFNIAGIELKPKVIENDDSIEKEYVDFEDEDEKDKGEISEGNKEESHSTFITDPEKESEA